MPMPFVEVLLGGETWLHFDPISGVLDSPECVRAELVRSHGDTPLVAAAVAHTVAAEKGVLTDVSQRYCQTWEDIQNARAPGAVLRAVLDAHCTSVDDEPKKPRSHAGPMPRTF